MPGTKEDLIIYRLIRAKEALDDARILVEKARWNSAINRLYYAAYYAVITLLLNIDLCPKTHNGVKTNFSEHFIKNGTLPKEYGKLYSQLFTWRQKGDYSDLFYFDSEKVIPYIEPVEKLIDLIAKQINLIEE
jgi:uncharacterized protein